MSDYHERIYALFDQTYGDASIEKVYLLEEAVRLADAHNDVELGFEGRMRLIHTATFAACSDRCLPAMAWLLAKTDEVPELLEHVGVYSLMWSYKWICQNIAQYPTVPLEKIESLIQDMSERYDQHGYAQRAVESCRMETCLVLGDAEGLRKAYKTWKSQRRGPMSDCQACEQNNEVRCHLMWGDVDKATQLAKPLLSGRMNCAEVPYSTYGHLLLPLFDTDQLKLADDLQRRAQRKIRSVPGERGLVGNQLAFLALTDQANRAVRLLDNNLTQALAITELVKRFCFLAGAAVLTKSLHKSGRESIKMKEHKVLEVACDKDRRYATDELGDWFEQKARAIADQYDRRAGTSYWAGQLDHELARVGTVKQIP